MESIDIQIDHELFEARESAESEGYKPIEEHIETKQTPEQVAEEKRMNALFVDEIKGMILKFFIAIFAFFSPKSIKIDVDGATHDLEGSKYLNAFFFKFLPVFATYVPSPIKASLIAGINIAPNVKYEPEEEINNDEEEQPEVVLE